MTDAAPYDQARTPYSVARMHDIRTLQARARMSADASCIRANHLAAERLIAAAIEDVVAAATAAGVLHCLALDVEAALRARLALGA